MFRIPFSVGIITASLVGLMTTTAQAVTLASHRAVYDITLKNASERSGIENVVGRMVYEFTGSDCDAYKMNFRYVTRIDTGDSSKVSDQQTTTFEDLKSGRFDFETKSFTDSQLDKTVKGSAGDDTDGVKVDLSVPDKKQVSLAASRFPTEHMIEVINHAKAGERFFESRIFDGSEDADKNMITTTVVGKLTEPKPLDADSEKLGPYLNQSYWPVVMSYFDDRDTNDEVPVYRMSFKLYENGVTRDLTMDYGDFVLAGKLSSIEVLKPDECKK